MSAKLSRCQMQAAPQSPRPSFRLSSTTLFQPPLPRPPFHSETLSMSSTDEPTKKDLNESRAEGAVLL